MTNTFLLILSLLLVITTLILVTYLVVKLPRANNSKLSERPIFVDTSVLIDGRIIAVAESGFIGDTLVIPKSVVRELQYLADKADHDKRARARYGLDIISKLQAIDTVRVEILQDGARSEGGVDERLLDLAKKHNGAVCTIDFNLNKVAATEKITVLNVNQLAQSLRMAYLPGERICLELVQKGQDSHQGVGYLADGTMVVVEQAVSLIGTSPEIEFIRSLQTAAGKMMFARLVEPKQNTSKQSQPAKNKAKRSLQSLVPKLPTTKKPATQPSVIQTPVQQKQTEQHNHESTDTAQTQKSYHSYTTKTNSQSRPHHNRSRPSVEDSLLELVDQTNRDK